MGRKFRSRCLTIAVFALFLCVSAAAREITVKVGVYDNPPKVFINEKGEADGFFVELTDLIAKQYGWKVSYVAGGWKEELNRLDSGEIDLMTDVAYSEDRSARWSFNRETVLSDWFQIYARKKADIKSVEDLLDKRVGILEDSVQADAFGKYIRDFGFSCELVSFSSYKRAFETLSRGEVDAVVVNRYYGQHNIGAYDVVETPIIFHPTRLHYAARKEIAESIIVDLDTALRELKASRNSEYYALLEKWFGEKTIARTPFWVKDLIWALFLASLLLIVFVLVLKRQVKRRTAMVVNMNMRLRESVAGRIKSEKRYKELFDNAPAAYIIIDSRNGMVSSVNNAAVSMFGYSKDEFIAMKLDKLFSESENGKKKARELHEKFLGRREGDVFQNMELEMRQKSGVLMWADVTLQTVYGESEDTGYVKVIISDVTEKKEMQARMIQSEKLESLGVLAGGVAHDFNNILTAIIGYSELLMFENPDDPKVKARANDIYRAGDRAKRLVNQILSFSRRRDVVLEAVSAKNVAEEVVNFLRASIPASVMIDLKTETDAHIKADPTQIHQVFMNICANAVQSMESGAGRLDIAISDRAFMEKAEMVTGFIAPGRYVAISFKDNGSGIPEKVLDSVFDPFFTTKARGLGAGMGLAVVHGIVKAHGGGIDVESAPGAGTTMTVYLPVCGECSAEAELKEDIGSIAPTCVMVVDDEPDICAIISEMLAEEGHRIVAFNNGGDALEHLKRDPYSCGLLITDLTMPVISGDILAMKALELNGRLPVILMTGFDPDTARDRFNGTNIVAVLKKPFTVAELMKVVKKSLG